MSPTILRLLIIACFFLSGMTGLIYQTAWARILGLVFGNTVHAVSTVLTVFFAGLAIGAYALGVVADRWGDRWGKGSLALLYGLLEIGIALWGFAVPWLFRVVETLYLHRLHPLDHSLLTLTIVRFLLAFLILIIPTTLMGGTLPVLVKFFVRSIGEVGRGFGMLYFVNTLGAALGVALCGFVLFQVTGVTGAIHLTAFFNFLIGLSACVVARFALPASREGKGEIGEGASSLEEGDHRLSPRLLLVASFLSGLAALAYETLFFRVLSIMLGDTIFVFAVILIVFLLGIGLGSAFFTRRADRIEHPESWYILCQGIVGGSILAVIPFLDRLPVVYLGIVALFERSMPGIHHSWKLVNLVKLLVCGMLLIVPTLHMGAAFPLLGRLYARSARRLGRDIGEIYHWNTLGGIAGSFLAGFLLLPLVGSRWGLLLTTWVTFAIALLLLLALGKRKSALVTAATIGFFFVAASLSPWDVMRMHGQVFLHYVDFGALGGAGKKEPGGEAPREGGEVRPSETGKRPPSPAERARRFRVLYYDEGITTTVLVTGDEKDLQIHIGSKVQATTYFDDLINQYLLAHLPMLLHEHPKRVLVTGLGAGITLGSVARYGSVERIDLVEISRNVIPAARQFAAINGNVLDDPRLRIIIADGRNYMLATGETYDVITTDAFDPFQTGTASFYAVDYFKASRAHLAPGGIFSLWLPLTSLTTEYNKVILRSLAEAFEHVSVWAIGPQCILVGTDRPLSIDVAAFSRRFHEPAVEAELARVSLREPETLIAFLSLTEKGLPALVAGVPLNTDDHPILEFSAARNLTLPTIGENQAFLAGVREGFAGEFRRLLVPPPDDPDFSERIARRYTIVTETLHALAALNEGDWEGAEPHFERAFALSPTDPYLCRLFEVSAGRILEMYRDRGDRTMSRRIADAMKRHLP